MYQYMYVLYAILYHCFRCVVLTVIFPLARQFTGTGICGIKSIIGFVFGCAPLKIYKFF